MTTRPRPWPRRRLPRWSRATSTPTARWSSIRLARAASNGGAAIRGPWRAEPLQPLRRVQVRASRLAIADTDGDGALELVANAAGTDPPGGWAVAHLDAARGPSVIGVPENGVPVIWNPGPGRHAYLGLRLSGRDPTSDQRRSNISGLGARVAVRTASRWTAFDNTRLESGPGQSLQPMSIGLGGAPRADFVAITWSDGVFQTELALDTGRLHRIGETQRQLSSCPVLFAWDGTPLPVRDRRARRRRHRLL